MPHFRTVLLGIVLISSLFLTGFKQHSPKNNVATKDKRIEETKKPLDLKMPHSEVSFLEIPEPLALVQNTQPVAFNPVKTKKIRTLELEGNVIMTQEQEAGKAKSADGAGIVINLHH